jgi:hypothetical protein
MKVPGKIVLAAVSFCIISQLSGCASSSLVNKWHDSSFQAPALSRMLVVSVRKDPAKRRIWEDAFSNELGKHGVSATPSYTIFPDAPPDTSQVATTLRMNMMDGILVIRRLPTESTTHFVEGYVTSEPSVRYSPYWQTYYTYYQEIQHPGYIDTQTVAIRAIDVTATRNGGRLVWSATSRTAEPASVTDMQRGIADLVISDLAHRKIIGERKK